MTNAFAIVGSPAYYWYWDIAHIDNMTVALGKTDPALGLVRDTHVVVEGQVIYRRAEDDGDYHFKLIDAAGRVLTCEIDPQDNLPHPAYQQNVRVYGILRFDFDHGWWEVHPVDWWEDQSVVPMPHA